MERLNNKLLCAWYITAIVIVAIFGVITFWLVYPYKTSEFTKVELVTKEAKAGELLKYKVDRCKYIDQGAVISKSFIDGIIYQMPNVWSDVGKGCEKDQVIAVEVPENLPSGEYYLNVLIVYEVNPIRKERVQFRTPKFIVR